jgi:hypothetical protein
MKETAAIAEAAAMPKHNTLAKTESGCVINITECSSTTEREIERERER